MLLSRVANQIYWLGRYVERASNIARFLEVNYHLQLDASLQGNEQWAPLIEVTSDMEIFRKLYPEITRDHVMHFLMFNPEYANSVASCLKNARDNARGVREILPPDLFEEINRVGKIVDVGTCDPSYFQTRVFELCREIKRESMLISGVLSETMERSRGYHVWRLGEFLERADKTSRILNVKYFYLLPHLSDVGSTLDDAHWTALLLSLDAREVYHRKHGLMDQNRVVDLIVRDEGFPRSIYFCLEAARWSLYRITGDAEAEPHEMLRALCDTLKQTQPADIIEEGLNEFIDTLQLRINKINDAIYLHLNR